MSTSKPAGFHLKLLLAFAAIYILWGSTYIAIRIAIETIPPFLMAGTRFIVAGLILYLWSGRAKGITTPTRLHWKNAAISAVPLFVIGNGGVTWAEQSVPSGIAALVVATLPAWLLLLDWSYGGRSGPRLPELLGISLGLIGVGTLSVSGDGSSGIDPMGLAALTAASIAWAFGSLFTRYAEFPTSPVRTSGMQMLVAGPIMFGVGLVLGEFGKLNVEAISLHSLLALIYLTSVALVALPAYNWLLTATSPALVGTYAFVNPVVAVLLGWAILGEGVSAKTGLAVVVIVAGVAMLTLFRKPVPKHKPIEEVALAER
jgi:drug/metabolite transporter (DMT)-like permease